MTFINKRQLNLLSILVSWLLYRITIRLSFPNSSQKYAVQKLVFDTLGCQILNNAWKSYQCYLFIYGHTCVSKSYSIIGYGNNKGIVPI